MRLKPFNSPVFEGIVRSSGITTLEGVRLARTVESLLNFAAEKGVRVLCARRGGSACYPDEMGIVVDISCSPRTVVHELMHELGHLVLSSDPRWAGVLGQEAARSKDDIVSVLAEEVEAWHMGWSLASGLGLDIDKGPFDRTRRRALGLYVAWAAAAFEARKRQKKA